MSPTERDEFLERVRRERVEAGLPEKIVDPIVIGQVVQVLREQEREVEPKA